MASTVACFTFISLSGKFNAMCGHHSIYTNSFTHNYGLLTFLQSLIATHWNDYGKPAMDVAIQKVLPFF